MYATMYITIYYIRVVNRLEIPVHYKVQCHVKKSRGSHESMLCKCDATAANSV